MLPATHRMRRSTQFSAAVRRGRRARRRTLVVHHQPDADPGQPATVGFVVSRAVGISTVRHRVTRQLRHLMRAHLDDLPAGSATVVRALPAAADSRGSVLAADLDAAVRATRESR